MLNDRNWLADLGLVRRRRHETTRRRAVAITADRLLAGLGIEAQHGEIELIDRARGGNAGGLAEAVGDTAVDLPSVAGDLEVEAADQLLRSIAAACGALERHVMVGEHQIVGD